MKLSTIFEAMNRARDHMEGCVESRKAGRIDIRVGTRPIGSTVAQTPVQHVPWTRLCKDCRV